MEWSAVAEERTKEGEEEEEEEEEEENSKVFFRSLCTRGKRERERKKQFKPPSFLPSFLPSFFVVVVLQVGGRRETIFTVSGEQEERKKQLKSVSGRTDSGEGLSQEAE